MRTLQIIVMEQLAIAAEICRAGALNFEENAAVEGSSAETEKATKDLREAAVLIDRAKHLIGKHRNGAGRAHE